MSNVDAGFVFTFIAYIAQVVCPAALAAHEGKAQNTKIHLTGRHFW